MKFEERVCLLKIYYQLDFTRFLTAGAGLHKICIMATKWLMLLNFGGGHYYLGFYVPILLFT